MSRGTALTYFWEIGGGVGRFAYAHEAASWMQQSNDPWKVLPRSRSSPDCEEKPMLPEGAEQAVKGRETYSRERSGSPAAGPSHPGLAAEMKLACGCGVG